MGMFTATRTQVASYLFGVCPFSIAFLVFLNSSVSFVITDLVGRQDGVGDAVGTLGFADELVALIACPFWGLLSDRIGVRSVCFIGYIIIGIALFVFVQAKNVYPQLLLGRLFFSIGGAAASTMVTAVLPTMSYIEPNADTVRGNGHRPVPSIASEQTITPGNFRTHSRDQTAETIDSTSKIAGFVGMATGCGALVALTLFLPLPARFQKSGIDPAHALQYSYYIVGTISILLAVTCLVGLHGLKSEQKKGWSFLLREHGRSTNLMDSAKLLYQAFLVGFTRADIFLGYVGGFVARASSVGISLFIPLLVNAAFLSSGLCAVESDTPSGLPEIKRKCPRAYTLAAELTGISQFVALILAPLFGYASSRIKNKALPLIIASIAGIIGYPLFAAEFDPHDENKPARAIAFIAVSLIGISQIGAIVCSLGILTAGILQKTNTNKFDSNSNTEQSVPESEPLLESTRTWQSQSKSLTELKGSVAGVYSFYGGAGILILTKAGGALFDSTTTAAPFYMMASFNTILLITASIASLRRR